MKTLILSGTKKGPRPGKLVADGHEVIPGRAGSQAAHAVVQVGGFGGRERAGRWLVGNRIDRVVERASTSPGRSAPMRWRPAQSTGTPLRISRLLGLAPAGRPGPGWPPDEASGKQPDEGFLPSGRQTRVAGPLPEPAGRRGPHGGTFEEPLPWLVAAAAGTRPSPSTLRRNLLRDLGSILLSRRTRAVP